MPPENRPEAWVVLDHPRCATCHAVEPAQVVLPRIDLDGRLDLRRRRERSQLGRRGRTEPPPSTTSRLPDRWQKPPTNYEFGPDQTEQNQEELSPR